MIQEFWIMDTAGVCYFHQVSKYSEEDEDQNVPVNQEKNHGDLFPPMFSAIMNLSDQIASDVIERLKLGEFKILFFTNKNLIYIVRADLNASDRKIKKKIGIIQTKFVKKFKNELQDFHGNPEAFQRFSDDLNILFEEMSRNEKWGTGLSELSF